MTDTNQKLREALHKAKAALSLALSDVDWRKDSLTQPVIHKAYNCAHEALAMPTADHLPDAGEMINGLTQAETDASASVSGLTAAPVGEQDAFERTMMDKFGWQRTDFKLDDFGYFDGHTDTAWMAWQARASLSAGDAGWQPIETAPKDGSDCWLLVDGDVRRGFWLEIEFEERRDMDGRYIDQTDADAYWMDHDSGDPLEPTMFYPITKPLHPYPVGIDAAMRKGQI
jgi:hypothetical protein